MPQPTTASSPAPVKTLSSQWTVVAVPPEREAAVILGSRANGRDDVFIRSKDQALHVAHGRVTGAEGLEAGDAVRLGEAVARVEGVESEENTYVDGLKARATPGVLIRTGVAAAVGVAAVGAMVAATTPVALVLPGLLASAAGLTVLASVAGLLLGGPRNANPKQDRLDVYDVGPKVQP